MTEIIIILVISAVALVLWTNYTARRRKEAIFAHIDTWGEDLCNVILNKKLRPGMTKEMVHLSWGRPNNIDKREVTASGEEKVRWVYGQPRKNARYIYFKQGKVVKIQT